MESFDELRPGLRVDGVDVSSIVTVVAVETHGEGSATLTYRTAIGPIEKLITIDDLPHFRLAPIRRWTFAADGKMFRLASEAHRIKWAPLSDPFAAVDTANIEPYPHQIEAVYDEFLNQQPLRFLLADDPGAGKTIMSGLLIRELMLRGDVTRCLIIAPGSLVEQWQDELADKFDLGFELMSRAAVEASQTGNPFAEKNMVVARIDQIARSDDLKAKLAATDWDLIIVDEAHKMAAHRYGEKLEKTKRFQLGEQLRELTRHFLLLSATPHNGKEEDFMAFMTLIDPARFGGRLRDGVPLDRSDMSGVMRRKVKEKLVTFERKRLFPPRKAHTVSFELSTAERELYEEVTAYVRTGMNAAKRMRDGGDRRRGVIVGFALAGLQRRLASSPDAIYHSLRRRRDRLATQADELRRLAAAGEPIPAADLPSGVRLADLQEFDDDNFDDAELEDLEDALIDATSAARTAEEIDAELIELKRLVTLAEKVRESRSDTKWVELRNVLRSDTFTDGTNARKLIVFSEHKDTLNYVAERVANELGRPEAVVTIHGGMQRLDRQREQEKFRFDPTVQVLVATDAAGEGVNLQAANLMVNYDLPWNPNRIEQRFGRIHRIGQTKFCHLWNLVAADTREGQVFERLFQKIEQQREVYGDQVYDVLGASHINTSLRGLLEQAIIEDDAAIRMRIMEQVIDVEIDETFKKTLDERRLVGGFDESSASSAEIRDRMERAKARRLQPGFIESFFVAALNEYGGRIAKRRYGRFEITRIPASIRNRAAVGTVVHKRYSRVTFDKRNITVDAPAEERADLISPGRPLLTAVIDTVLGDHGSTLDAGAILVDPIGSGSEPRLLVYVDHTITDGRIRRDGHRQRVSQRLHYVEIDRRGTIRGFDHAPYLDYAPITDDQLARIAPLADYTDWVDDTVESAARNHAIAHLAQPHFDDVRAATEERVAKVRQAVKERLTSEIRYWDAQAQNSRDEEAAGKKPPVTVAVAEERANRLHVSLDERYADLDRQGDLSNHPPTIVGAALIIPYHLVADDDDPSSPEPRTPETDETDRRAIAAAMDAERSIGREPTEQDHNNPGYDIESVDPETGVHYFIEVKGHLPQTTTIRVSARQILQAKNNPERWRLVVVSVPEETDDEPIVSYFVEPFRNTQCHFAQNFVPLEVSDLLNEAELPR